MRLLYDAVLPKSLSLEAPAQCELLRWDGNDVDDRELVKIASERGCRALILLGRDSLEQPDLRKVAEQAGVALITVATEHPLKAKQRVLKHFGTIREKITDHNCLIILSAEVRPA